MDFTYIIAAIVLLHFIVGFAYLFYKLSKPKASKKEESDAQPPQH